jgi:hypothetical protein
MTAMYNTALLLTALVASTGCVTEDPAAGGSNPQPTIEITSPLSGTTVSSVVTVFATASAVAGTPVRVRFLFPDGASITDTVPPFSAAWDSATVVDGSYPITATAIDDLGAATTTHVTIAVANAGCLASTFVARDLPRDIPDGDPIGVTSSLPVTGDGGVASLALSLRIAHPFPPELLVTLISPAGTQLPITELAGDPIAGGVAINDQQLSAFNGQSAAGIWTLAVQDLAVGDIGTLDAWSLSIAKNCSPIRR